MKGCLFLMMISFYSFSQEFNYEARSSAFEFCKCINEFSDYEEDYVNLIIDYHTLNSNEFNKTLNRYPYHIKKSFKENLTRFLSENSIARQESCLTKIKKEIEHQDHLLVESKNSFIEMVTTYLGYDYNCKLAKFILEKFI